MSKRNTKPNAWIIMSEYTATGCKAPDELSQSTSPDSLEDVGSTPQNQVPKSDLVGGHENKLQRWLDASMMTKATTKPRICRCRCTCNLKEGLGNDQMSMNLKREISASWKHYELSSSPDSQVISSESALPDISDPRSIGGSEAWNLPRVLPGDLPMDLQDDLYQLYQSEDDTTSEEDAKEYAMALCEEAGTIAQGLVDTEPSAPDMAQVERNAGEGHPQTETGFDSNKDHAFP